MKKQSHQKNQKEKIMIDFILEQLVTWWQFTVVGILIIIGFIINLFGIESPGLTSSIQIGKYVLNIFKS